MTTRKWTKAQLEEYLAFSKNVLKDAQRLQIPQYKAEGIQDYWTSEVTSTEERLYTLTHGDA